MKALQGEWVQVAYTLNGENLDDGPKFKMTIEGNTFLYLTERNKFTVDPTKNPKEMDYVPQGGFDKGKRSSPSMS